jgi:exopolysaccharide biosynthesis protein
LAPTSTPTPKPSLPSTPAGSGYSRVSATTGAGTFTVDLIAADLSSTRVIVDTASSSDCRDNCPVLSLGDYVGRNGAFAGINGSFFCPASYPSCAGKTNSFDTLVMNKNKTYFNSDNNVYSTVPAVIFAPGSIRFVSQSLEWGRDTGIDSMIANYPLYLSGGNNVFGGSSDSKLTAKGARTFVGGGSGKVYIGVVQNATSGEVPDILKKLGIQDALGMDQGGSTALWANGRYIMGPGRGIPTAILFTRR